MRKVSWLCAFAFVSLFAEAQTATVSGTIYDPSTTAGTNVQLHFVLKGCAGNQPRYNGVALITGEYDGADVAKTFDANTSTGAISGTIIRNDSVTCGTSTTSNYWAMTVIHNGTAGPVCNVRITATPFDATQPSCLNQNPAPAVTTNISSSYLLIDQTNGPITGNVLPNGNGTLNLGSSSFRWNGFWKDANLSGTFTLGAAAIVSITAGATVTGNIIPTVNNTQTLGDSTHRWDLYGDASDVTSVTASGNVAGGTIQSNAVSGAATRWNPKQALVRVTKSGTQSISNATQTAVTWDTETFDTDTLHNTVSTTDRLTASATGKWLVTVSTHFAANATGFRQVRILKNGTTLYSSANTAAVNGTDETRVATSEIVDLTSAEYVTVEVYQSSGGNLNLAASSSFSMVLVGN